METFNELEVEGTVKALTVGGVASAVGGRVIVTEALLLVETLPAASLAQA
jgi:hypothetical protein